MSGVVIVGASAAGLRCAARLRRLQPERPVAVVEQNETFSVAACGMPYVLSGDIADAQALLKTGDGVVRDVDYFSAVKGVTVLAGRRAVGVDTGKKVLRVAGPAGEQELGYDDLVLATGARARRLPGQPDHPRVRSFHAFSDLAPLDMGLKKGEIEKVVIVGAGLVGCELAESFRSLWDADVTLLEAGGWPLPQILDAECGSIAAREIRANEVELHCDTLVERVEADDQGVTVSAAGKTFSGDVAMVAFGLEPAVELAREAGVKLGPTGAIAVDERLATSVEHVWAVGDCAEVAHAITGTPAWLPLGSLANRQGRTLANVLAGRDDGFPPVAGACAVKVFDLNVAAAGIPLSRARKMFAAADAVWTSPHDRAHYWPDAKNIFIQLTYDGDSRRVLGVQVVGPGECAKRVDVAAQLLVRGETLADFAQLEHAYAPPYSPAMEGLAQAAMVAENRLDGLDLCSPHTDLAGAKLLDVRHDHEREERPIDADEVTAIDQLELRDRLSELDAGPWTVVCDRGVRSAEAARLLQSKGVQADFLGGGVAWVNAAGKRKDGRHGHGKGRAGKDRRGREEP